MLLKSILKGYPHGLSHLYTVFNSPSICILFTNFVILLLTSHFWCNQQKIMLTLLCLEFWDDDVIHNGWLPLLCFKKGESSTCWDTTVCKKSTKSMDKMNIPYLTSWFPKTVQWLLQDHSFTFGEESQRISIISTLSCVKTHV